jgi:FkbH-like protein
MVNTRSTGVVISDFNANNLGGYLSNDEEVPVLEVRVAPFGQPVQMLGSKDFGGVEETPDFLVVWTQPQSVIASFRDALDGRLPGIDSILEEVDEFAAQLAGAAKRVKYIFVPTWVMPFHNRGLGLLDLAPKRGINDILNRMNLRLSERLASEPGVFLFNAQRWNAAAGRRAFSPKLWYMAKVPFSNEVFKEALKDIKAALRTLNGYARKLIILDLDDTLWGGTVGDVGWENLRLGGHDHIGEAYVDFQRALKSLANRGVLLAIVSKNEEEIALEAIAKHPEMVLKLEDFARWRINWQDKALSIAELVSELNLGLQSTVFLDDNPVERERVKDALPEVLVPDWPNDPAFFPSALLEMDCFDTSSITQEDLERTRQYASQRERENSRRLVSSPQEWLQKLGITVKVEEPNEGNIKRIVQLLAKTNQMNLSTRRLSELELRDWMAKDDHRLWAFRVSDKFGDSGLTGVVSLECSEGAAFIVDFVLSCRVMGRGVEEAMLSTAIEYARIVDAREMRATLIPTKKNKPCLRFFEESSFVAGGEHVFTWNLGVPYGPPSHLTIEQATPSRGAIGSTPVMAGAGWK